MAYTNGPLVTIITVTYNSEAFIRATMDSVLAQTAGNIEYIVGDDCSTDKTWDVVSEYADSRIVRYRNQTNLREYPNRSKALGMASGKYVIYIDGDDIMYPHAIETFLWYAERFPECATFYSRDWDNRILCPCKLKPENIFQFEYLDLGIIGGSFANVFFDTAVLKTFGLPLNIRTGDSYIQLKIGQQYPALVIPGSLAWWRQRSGNATEVFFSDYRNYAEVIRYRLDLLNKDCPLNEQEQEWAKKNIYGGILRIIARLFLKAKITPALYLLRTLKIPVIYYGFVFIRARHNYFSNIKGDAPLHTTR